MRGLGFLLSSLLLIVGSTTFYVLNPFEKLVTAPAHSPLLSPSESPEVLGPSDSPTEAPRPSQTPSGAFTVDPLPSLPLPTVPQVSIEPSFIPLPTPALPTLPPLGDGCYRVEITPNTPTGIAGCVRFGAGTASSYAGTGAAMNFCTWTLRHEQGCGSVKVTSISTGLTLRLPVTDFCDCYTTTERERIIDLPLTALPSLGLNPLDGLWSVTVER